MRAHTALDEIAADGAFKRSDAGHRNKIAAGSAFAPAAGRYHLYVALACPWADGVLSMVHLKGLEDVISVSKVHPTWVRTRPDDPNDAHCGWQFRAPGDPPVPNTLGHGANVVDDECVPDTVNGCRTMRELYEKGRDTHGKYSTPLLWDKETGAIVNNESLDLLRMLNSAFGKLGNALDLFPPHLEAETAALNEWIYPAINDGVYRAGFAQTQDAHASAVTALFAALDRADTLLATRRYLAGAELTWVDLRLFHTLVRFDPVYVTYFKCNLKRIAEYPHLPNYVRDIYQIPAVKRTVNMAHIKMHYFTSHPLLNTFGIVPLHNGFDLDAPHGREHFGAEGK
ncbi:hypothetical protein KFE25_002531 [Diacronema lutheri]|uniref:GST C-terminal domain-containing protein n=1 Tax=Diacronema lutheri TaxID=2081491 RepID=A0A8J5XEB4_DIALT|nr:hypothetical protein KFE25_002531 [Diacronema lutheri]